MQVLSRLMQSVVKALFLVQKKDERQCVYDISSEEA